METIKELLQKLDNQVTPSMAKRLDGFQALQQKLAVAKEEYEADPTDEKSNELEEVKEFIADQMEDIVEDLKVLVRRKKFAEEEDKSAQSTPKTNETLKGSETPKDEEKGFGWAGWLFGGALLVASLGTINYFRNNR